jgi:hypothetical protein
MVEVELGEKEFQTALGAKVYFRKCTQSTLCKASLDLFPGHDQCSAGEQRRVPWQLNVCINKVSLTLCISIFGKIRNEN